MKANIIVHINEKLMLEKEKAYLKQLDKKFVEKYEKKRLE